MKKIIGKLITIFAHMAAKIKPLWYFQIINYMRERELFGFREERIK